MNTLILPIFIQKLCSFKLKNSENIFFSSLILLHWNSFLSNQTGCMSGQTFPWPDLWQAWGKNYLQAWFSILIPLYYRVQLYNIPNVPCAHDDGNDIRIIIMKNNKNSYHHHLLCNQCNVVIIITLNYHFWYSCAFDVLFAVTMNIVIYCPVTFICIIWIRYMNFTYLNCRMKQIFSVVWSSQL